MCGCGSWWSAFYHRCPASIPGQYFRDLFWRKWNWDMFICEYLGFPCQCHSTSKRKRKSFPAADLDGPLGFQKAEAPEFLDSRHMKVVRLQPYAPAVFTPRKDSWYSFLLEAESTPGPQCDRKDWITETCDLPVCSAVPQPTAPPRTPISLVFSLIYRRCIIVTLRPSGRRQSSNFLGLEQDWRIFLRTCAQIESTIRKTLSRVETCIYS
jgi:hypothetical protein